MEVESILPITVTTAESESIRKVLHCSATSTLQSEGARKRKRLLDGNFKIDWEVCNTKRLCSDIQLSSVNQAEQSKKVYKEVLQVDGNTGEYGKSASLTIFSSAYSAYRERHQNGEDCSHGAAGAGFARSDESGGEISAGSRSTVTYSEGDDSGLVHRFSHMPQVSCTFARYGEKEEDSLRRLSAGTSMTNLLDSFKVRGKYVEHEAGDGEVMNSHRTGLGNVAPFWDQTDRLPDMGLLGAMLGKYGSDRSCPTSMNKQSSKEVETKSMPESILCKVRSLESKSEYQGCRSGTFSPKTQRSSEDICASSCSDSIQSAVWSRSSSMWSNFHASTRRQEDTSSVVFSDKMAISSMLIGGDNAESSDGACKFHDVGVSLEKGERSSWERETYLCGDNGTLSACEPSDSYEEKPPPTFVLSSGRLSREQEAQLGKRLPTIDDAFELYFAQLML